ncbi:MAG: outer membrane lipoprotein carrier protein LolA [Bacteroidetes bacterium]|nr:outer membrane lipoprotein carrier protein LolA [Bacteroidota bacterium]
MKINSIIPKYSIAIYIVVAIMFVRHDASAHKSSEEVYNSIKKKYGSASSLQCTFSSAVGSQNSITGTVKAKKGNKYILNFGSRIIVCNGETIWNFTKISNSVVVSNYEDKGQISIEKVFFTFLNAYTSATVLSEQSSKGDKFITLRLLPESPDKIISGVRSISLSLSPKSLALQRISITDASSTQVWKISSLKTDITLSDSTFEFTAPKDAQVVDMR